MPFSGRAREHMSLHNNNYDNHNDAAAELTEATADLRSQEFSSADEAGFDASADMDIDADVEAAGEVNGFEAMNLNPALLQAVAALGYTQPTAVQVQTIPNALAGGDWMVSSQTGSGKTAAFLLPALHALLETPAMSKGEQAARSRRAGASPRVLVLCPTRELAAQVAAEAISLVRFVRGIRIANVVGGTAFGKQLMELRGANLVVATPGRLLDLNRNGQIDLDCVQTLVVDEADRMLDLGFSEDLEAIHVATQRRERTMMFSATFAPRVMQLAAAVMRDPKRIELATAQDAHQNIEQRLHWYDDMTHKNAILEHYLQDETMDQAVIFTATQIETDELADELRNAGYAAAGLHGAMPQMIRTRRLKSLRDGTIKVLIATDVAARGIDVPTITHVINYGLPMKPEDYIHRIGRTGRAGKSGLAITLAGFRDRFKIRNIERFTQQRIDEAVVAGHEPQNKPPAAGGYGGGGYGGGAGRSYGGGGGYAGGGNRGGYDRGSAGGGGYRGQGGNSGGGYGGERSFDRAPRPAYAPAPSAEPVARSFDRAPAEQQRFGDDRAAAPRFGADRGAPRAGGYDRGAPRFGDDRAPRHGEERGASRFSRDAAPRRDFGDRAERTYAPREDRAPRFGADRPPFADRGNRGFAGSSDRDSRPAWGDRSAPRREFGDAAQFSAPRREFAPRADRAEHAPFDAPFQRPARADTTPRGSRGEFAHDVRAERRGNAPAGPAVTPAPDGGNRAARRAAKQAEYAARVAAGQGAE